MIELEPLFSGRLAVATSYRVGKGPAGDRTVGITTEGRFEGPRFNAQVRGFGADWLAVSAGRVGTVDARLLLETDDGALVYMRYGGRVDLEGGFGTVYIAPVFETGAEAYRWLTTIQAVGKGVPDAGGITYEVAAVR